MPQAQAWFFMNAFCLSSTERDWIERNLKKDGNILIWVYAPGFYRDAKADICHASEITGIKLRLDFASHLGDVSITQPSHPALAGLRGEPAGSFYEHINIAPPSGNVQRISPEIYVDDPQAETLGVNCHSGRGNFAVRDYGHYKTVYVAGPMVPHRIMRSLLEWNSMRPVLNTADCFYGNGEILGIYATSAGPKTLELPGEFVLEDLWDGGVQESCNCRVTLEMREREMFVGRVCSKTGAH